MFEPIPYQHADFFLIVLNFSNIQETPEWSGQLSNLLFLDVGTNSLDDKHHIDCTSFSSIELRYCVNFLVKNKYPSLVHILYRHMVWGRGKGQQLLKFSEMLA